MSFLVFFEDSNVSQKIGVCSKKQKTKSEKQKCLFGVSKRLEVFFPFLKFRHSLIEIFHKCVSKFSQDESEALIPFQR